jgi:hypothetical protein
MSVWYQVNWMKCTDMHFHASESSIRVIIWVILSCTKGWGKDVCLVPGELNEMHRHALSRIWVQLVKWNLQEGVPANIQLVQLIKWCFSRKGQALLVHAALYGWLYGWFCPVLRVGVRMSVWYQVNSMKCTDMRFHTSESSIWVIIWVILSCTEGWGKDVCLVPGELNEMHRHYIGYLGMEKGGVTLSVRRSTSVSQTNGILRHECRRISIIHCILVTTMCHQWKSAARLSQNFHYSII